MNIKSIKNPDKSTNICIFLIALYSLGERNGIVQIKSV